MPPTATDTELVHQYLAGDQRALGDIYERYGDRVYDLCFAMLQSGDDAADAYQDTFLTAANKLDQLRDTERLRSWLYSVARNQCRARLRARKRSTPVDDAGVDIGTEVDMTADLGRDELRVLLTEASAGLNEREREVLDLHMRHELEGEELADALGVSAQNAYKLVQRVRDRVERSLGSLLIARHGRRECPELDTLLGSWDGVFNPLWRKRISRHIDDCSTCTRRRAGLMDPGGLAGAFPLQPAPEAAKTALQAALLDAARPAHEIRRWRRDGFPAAPRRIPKLLFTAIAGGALVVGGLAGGLAVTELIDRTDPQLDTVAPVVTTTSTTSLPATTTLPASTTTTTQSTVPATTSTATPTTTTAPPTTTAAQTTTAAPTTTTSTTTTTTTTTTLPIDTEAPTINSIAASPNGKHNPVFEHKCGENTAVVTVDTSDNVGVVRVDITYSDALSSSGPIETIELESNGPDLWTNTISFLRGTAPTSSHAEVVFTAIAFDAAGNASETVTTQERTYLFPCD